MGKNGAAFEDFKSQIGDRKSQITNRNRENRTWKIANHPSQIDNRQSKMDNSPMARLPLKPDSWHLTPDLAPRPCPEIGGRFDGDELEINQVVPMARPASQQFRIRCIHDLKTASPIRIHPARVIDDALREHPGATLEALTDQRDATRLEVFDDHEDHAPESIPPWAQVKPCAGGAPRPVNPGLRQSPMGLERTPHLPSSVGHPPGLASC